jgi:hypothetical protein
MYEFVTFSINFFFRILSKPMFLYIIILCIFNSMLLYTYYIISLRMLFQTLLTFTPFIFYYQIYHPGNSVRATGTHVTEMSLNIFLHTILYEQNKLVQTVLFDLL